MGSVFDEEVWDEELWPESDCASSRHDSPSRIPKKVTLEIDFMGTLLAAARLLIYENAPARSRRNVAAMDGTMATGAAIQQGHSGTVVVAGVALQAKRGLTRHQQTALHGAVRGVALTATLNHGRVLKGEWSLVLSMALEAEIVDI